MEQTLGKRIRRYRKNLGMTQDKLAEQLGVTAQAVSKWENDQSCPDITMLPKLAQILGTTTDELLGRNAQDTVYHAEVVEEETPDDATGIHLNTEKDGHWSFTWESGRKNAIAFAIWVLLIGGLCIANTILQWNVSFWSMLWPSFLLIYGILGLTKRFDFFSIGCTLFGGYFLVSNLGIWHVNIGKELVLPIILVLFGLFLLVDALRKPKKPHFHFTRNGKKVIDQAQKTKNVFYTDEESFTCSLSFGDADRLIDMSRLSEGEMECNFGSLTVDLSGCEEIADRCHLDAECSFGELVIKVPSQYRVEPDSDTSFGSFSINGHPDATPIATILLDADVSFGSITIQYI